MPEQSAIPVLITRPEPQASRFAAELAAAAPRAKPVISPLMRTEFLAPALPPGRFAALILTSETGAEAAGRLRKQSLSLPDTAFCVGDRTAEAARAQGLHAIAAAGTAEDLAALILSRPDAGPMLWLHGRDIAADIGAMLAAGGRDVVAACVYAQVESPLTAAAAALLAQPGPVVLPVFSPRSARLLAAALPAAAQARLLPVAISARAAAALPAALQAQAAMAAAPDGSAMIRAILRVISSLSP